MPLTFTDGEVETRHHVESAASALYAAASLAGVPMEGIETSSRSASCTSCGRPDSAPSETVISLGALTPVLAERLTAILRRAAPGGEQAVTEGRAADE